MFQINFNNFFFNLDPNKNKLVYFKTKKTGFHKFFGNNPQLKEIISIKYRFVLKLNQKIK